MKPKILFLFSAFLPLVLGISGCQTSTLSLLNQKRELAAVKEWAVVLDYSPERPLAAAAVLSKDMMIVDPDHAPPGAGTAEEVCWIAYLSVGEAESYRAYWPKIKDRPWIAGENPDWENNYLVDVRAEEWRRLLLEEVIPAIAAKGFDGLMLDTLDTATTLESLGPEYGGVSEAMTDLVAAIHERFPGLMLISNNGFSILPKLAPYLSGMLVEDIYGMADFENGTHKAVPREEREAKIAVLKPLMRKYQLPVFDIEYVDEQDASLREKNLQASRALGFIPYAAEKDLARIYRQS